MARSTSSRRGGCPAGGAGRTGFGRFESVLFGMAVRYQTSRDPATTPEAHRISPNVCRTVEVSVF